MAHRFNRIVLACAVVGLFIFLAATVIGVVFRFGFGVGHVMLQDIQLYAFTFFVPIAILYAALSEKHVRAELPLFRSERYINGKIVQTIFVVVPTAFISVLIVPVILLAWQSLEGSAEPAGLGGYFLVKSVLPIVFLLIAINAAKMSWVGNSSAPQTRNHQD